jgi:hypothetical protein
MSASYSAYRVAYPINDLHSHVTMHIKKIPLEIHVVYLGNKKIYSLLRQAK